MKKMRSNIRSLYAGTARWRFACTVGMLLFMAIPGRAQVFRAGASVVDVSPKLGQGIVGNFIVPPATHIHDPLSARSLVLDDGETKLVFVVVDNVGVDQPVFDEAGKMIRQETGINPAQVLMSATHTHSGVSASGDGERFRKDRKGILLDDYQKFLARRIADGVRIAVNNLEPARIGWGSGSVPQHVFNRRWKLKNEVRNPFGQMDAAMFNPGVNNANKTEPAGTTDPEVAFLSVQSVNGRPIGLLANYSLHYVGGVPTGHVSADYFALFAGKLARHLGQQQQFPPFVGFLTNGTSGDVNNIDFSKQGKAYGPYEKMNIVAEDVAREVLRVYQNIEYRPHVKLRSVRSEIPIKVRKPSRELYERSKSVRDSPSDKKFEHSLERVFADRAIHIYEDWPAEIAVPLQVFKIGEWGVRAVPFEVFTETGLDLKKTSPFKNSFTISLANGCYGYLAPPAQHRLGGYETWLTVTKVEETASEKIVAELTKLSDSLR
ncbi:neutral/alkaline non-lysosomal ceramidase N-terminal domain-containing protein [Ravibacter arvi]|uniref:Neutral/alkaline non-lysosomal ceramidase N-terminal domain-containing protein n=1 Tax=Ravibacter arvi TaxID=2051041 RepID=A0ABP8M889_9BACT